MTMHLEGPWLSSTRTKKRQEKITKAKQAELEQGWRDRNKRLKEIGLPKETFEQYVEWVYGKGKKSKVTKGQESAIAVANRILKGNANDTERQEKAPGITVSNRSSWITGPVASKPSPVYTGTKVIGIGTMHKSNAVPIFSDDEAKDISKMRRG